MYLILSNLVFILNNVVLTDAIYFMTLHIMTFEMAFYNQLNEMPRNTFQHSKGETEKFAQLMCLWISLHFL
jgi:hypothetical protein